MGNIATINYFSSKPTYVAPDESEANKYFETLASNYKVSKDTYNQVEAYMSNLKAPDGDENASKYIETVKNNVRESLSQISKDVNNNIRYEEGLENASKLAMSIASDEILNHIGTEKEKIDAARARKELMASQGLRPQGFGDASKESKPFFTVTFDPKTKKYVKNNYNGWYEPHGAWSEGYTGLTGNMPYVDKVRLRDISTKLSGKQPLSLEEKTFYNSTIESLYSKSKGIAELEQDAELLLSKFGGDENKVKEFVINQRLLPSIQSVSKEEANTEMQLIKNEEMFKNRLDLEEAKAGYRSDLQEQGAENKFELAKFNAMSDLDKEAYKSASKVELEKLRQEGKLTQAEVNYRFKTKLEEDKVAFKNAKTTGNKSVAGLSRNYASHMFNDIPTMDSYSSNNDKKTLDLEITNPSGNVLDQKGYLASLRRFDRNSRDLKEDTKNKNYHAKEVNRLRVFRNAIPEMNINGKIVKTSELSDRSFIQLYNQAAEKQTSKISKTSQIAFDEATKKEFDDYFFRVIGMGNTLGAIEGRDLNDTKTIHDKLVASNFTTAEIAKLSSDNIKFKGIVSISSSQKNRALDGAYSYTVTSGGKTVNLLVPSHDEVRGTFKAVNDAFDLAIKTNVGFTAKGVSAGFVDVESLLGFPGMVLQPQTYYDSKDGSLKTKFKPSYRTTDGRVTGLYDNMKEDYFKRTGTTIDDFYTLEDLRQISLAKVAQTGIIQKAIAPKKEVK